jgi:hypothetical protein
MPKATPTAPASDTEFSLVGLGTDEPTTPATDENGFPLSYSDPTPNPSPENPVSTATAEPTAPETNGKPKSEPAGEPKAGKGKAPKAPKAKKTKAAAPKPEKAKKPRVFGGPRVPTGMVKKLPLDTLTFDRKLQARAHFTDDETVERYRLVNLDDPERLPAIRAVDIGDAEAEKRRTTRYIVWDGFQRGAARRAAKMSDIKVEVVVGTYDDAVRYSLGANGGHGLPRTSADLRRAFDRLIKNEALFEQVVKESRGKGGPQAGIARAIDVSTGTVYNILKSMGLQVRGDKLVNRPAVDPGEVQHDRSEGDPADGAGERVESKKAIKSRLTAVVVKEACYAAAQIQRRVEDLADRDDCRELLLQVASKNGIPIKVDTSTKNGKPVETRYWPAIDVILKTIEEVQDQFAKMNTSSTV